MMKFILAFLRSFRRDPHNGAVFVLSLASVVLTIVYVCNNPSFFWVQWVAGMLNIPLFGTLIIRDRRRRKEHNADLAHIKFWKDEIDRQSRELALLILSGKVGLAVMTRSDSEEQAEASAEVQHLHVMTVVEGVRNAMNRHSRETDVILKKLEARGVVNKEDLNRFTNGQKKQTEE